MAAGTGEGRPGHAVDERAFTALNGEAAATADALLAGLTELGSIAAAAGAAGVLAASGRRRAAVGGLGAAAAMWVVGQALKRATDRPRPCDQPGRARLLIERPDSSSWPSSHPGVLLAFLTVAGRELGLRRPARRRLAALAGVVALSRVAVGVHWPSDVAGGLLLGRAVGDVWSAARWPPG